MKDAKCKKCLQKFHQKDIYTIQQFQYRKIPPYKWTIIYFAKLSITEWDSFCESCLLEYQKESAEQFQKA